MTSIKANTTIKEYQDFIGEIYGFPDDRHFTSWDMLTNVQRFSMRGLKGIRKKDYKKTKINLLISLSWFSSLLNQLHINLEEEVWKRFPYTCSYCGSCPCSCKKEKITKRRKKIKNDKTRPLTFKDYQTMFEKVYPSKNRSIQDAGIHLAEETGEMSEAFLSFRGSHKKSDFNNIGIETADFFSCLIGVFNSLKINVAKELSILFSNNCHVCNKKPCECGFENVMRFKS